MILALLVLGQLGYLGRGLVNGEIKRMEGLFREFGLTPPAITKVVLRPGLIPGVVAALAIACVGITVAGLRASRDPRRQTLGTVAWLVVLLAASIFVTTIVSLALLMPLVDPIHSHK